MYHRTFQYIQALQVNFRNMIENKPQSEVALRHYACSSYSKAFFQFTHTLVLYALVIAAMYYSLSIHYGLTLLLSLVATAAYLRLFMIGHDCGHNSYLPKKWQNQMLGNTIGILTNTPLRYWANQHALHHRTTGNLDKRGVGDINTLTVNEFRELGLSDRIVYRIYRNPLFLFFIAPPIHFLLMQRLPLGDQMKTKVGWMSTMGTNIGISCYYGSLIWAFGLTPFLWVFTPVVLLSATGAMWLFYVQHQFDDAYWQRSENWNYQDATLLGSSFYHLPKWMHWVSCNIGYHHIHHLNPTIPNYNLPACFEINSDLSTVKNFGFFESLQTATLALWDESRDKLITFSEYRNLFKNVQS